MKSKMISIGLALGVLVSARQASATVTVQGWWHFDGLNAGGNPADASGNGRDYRAGGIVNAGGFAALAGALVSSEAAGGPLGVPPCPAAGYISAQALRLGLEGDSDTFWQVGTNANDSYVPPPTNYIVEIWVKPQGSTNNNNLGGYWYDPGNEVWIFSSGGFDVGRSAFGWGGACVRVKNEGGNITPYIQAGFENGADSHNVIDFGPHIPVDTNAWMHMALVNTNGVLSFWTNGVLCAIYSGTPTAPGGVLHLGTDGAWNGFNGYIDEERVLTFNDGDFSPSLFLYTPSPRIVQQPQNITVWSNGAATFQVDVSQDPCPSYQWYLYGTNLLSGAFTPDLYLDPLSLTNSGQWYNCQLNCGTNNVTTANATLTVVTPNMDNVNAYRNAVESVPTLESYFIVDGDTGPIPGGTVHDWKGNSNGTLQGGADYDGQTDRSFGERAIFIKHGDGDVQIAHNDEYEFGPGGGTVEALVYLMSPVTPEPGACSTIFSVAKADGSTIRYQFAVTSDGGNLVYTNNSGVRLSWGVPNSLLNRFAHVAFVFNDATHVTAYVDGVSLGTLTQTGFGTSDASDHGWIGFGPGLGSPSPTFTNAVPAYWYGTIDELAIYTNALAATNIAIHNSKFLYGTNTTPPTIVSQTTGPKTLFTGGSPVLSVVAAGTPPLSYQWYSNGVAVAGATSPTLTLNPTTAYSAVYSNSVVNLYGSAVTAPIALTFVNPPTGDPKVVAVMADHPTAFWRLNELAGPTAVDSAGGNDGTYNASGVTYGVAGPPGDPETAVSFDGTAGRVVVPYTPVLNPSGPFTIEFWAAPNAVGAEGPVASMVPARSGGYEFYLGGNYGGYEFHTAAGGVYNMITGEGAAPPLGQWAHVVGVCDGANNISLYVDGYLVGTDNNVTEGTPPFAANLSNPFFIGCRRSSTWFFNGAMSEVAFYNYALTSTQILHHLAVGLPQKLAITIATNVIEDSNPSSPPQDGLNQRATWLASYSDGTTTHTGVMSFAATDDRKISVFNYPHLSNTTNGTIMFWMCSTGVVTTANGGGGGGYDEAAILFDWRAPGTYGGLIIGQIGYQTDWHPVVGAIMVQGGNGGPLGGVPGTIGGDTLNVSDGTWHNIAVTYDTSSASSPSIALYVDGAYRAGALALADWVWPGQNYTIQMGADDLYDAWWNNYEGKLADIRIYNKILDTTDLGTAMGGGLLTTNLILRYNFDAAPNGYVVTWPYGDLQTATNVTGPYSLPGGLTNTPPFPRLSPFPVANSTAKRLGQQYFRGKQ